MPDENYINSYYLHLSMSMRLFLIIYSFYVFTEHNQENLNKPYRMNRQWIKYICEKILPKKIQEERERLEEEARLAKYI